MYSACYPKTARRQGNRIVHAQRSDGGASAWCQSKDSCAILAPLKVFVPPLTTWIKESHLTARFRVARMTLLSLELITEWTAQAQVLKLGRSTCRLRDDMVNVETRQGQLLGVRQYSHRLFAARITCFRSACRTRGIMSTDYRSADAARRASSKMYLALAFSTNPAPYAF